jgi:hypothetical protein
MENSVPGLAGRAVPAGPRHAMALHRGSPERVKITGTISWRQFRADPEDLRRHNQWRRDPGRARSGLT